MNALNDGAVILIKSYSLVHLDFLMVLNLC